MGVIHLEGRDEVLIGHLEQMDDGFVQLFSGDPFRVPVADLNIGTDGLTIGLISTKPLSYCDGKTQIPHILGMPIQDAREKLFESGFDPIENEQASESWTSKYYPDINELAGCSNGIPWCFFEYEDKYSQLDLRTLG